MIDLYVSLAYFNDRLNESISRGGVSRVCTLLVWLLCLFCLLGVGLGGFQLVNNRRSSKKKTVGIDNWTASKEGLDGIIR